jgi:hypothetical protein
MEESSGRHREMLLHPEWWPLWPFLPLKRSKEGERELGVFYESTKGKIEVIMSNVFADDFCRAPRKEYPSIDALLADGWVVD